MPVSDTAFRFALAALLHDPLSGVDPGLRATIDAYLHPLSTTRVDRAALETQLLAWADAQGREVGTTLRHAIEGRPKETLPGRHYLTERTETMATIPYDIPDATPVLSRDGMTRLAAVLDTMQEPPYNLKPNHLQSAYDAVLEGRVTPGTYPGTVVVESRPAAEGTYTVRDGACTCKYAVTHPHELYGCYHTVAAVLSTRYEATLHPDVLVGQVVETPMPTSPQTTFVEAPSVPQGPLSLPPLSPETLSLPLRPLRAIVADLSRPLPAACEAVLPAVEGKGKRPALRYLHWHTVTAVLDAYAPGWEGSVVRVEKIGTKIAITYRLTVHAAEGPCSREDVGMEDETKDGYGDAMTNALATALKRCAAKFGLGAYLYAHDGTLEAVQAYLKTAQVEGMVSDDEGATSRPPPPAEDSAPPPRTQYELRKEIPRLLSQLGETPTTKKEYAAVILQYTMLPLVPEQYAAIVARLTALVEKR